MEALFTEYLFFYEEMILASKPISSKASRMFLLLWVGGGLFTLQDDPALLCSVAAQEMTQAWWGINPPKEAADTQWNQAKRSLHLSQDMQFLFKAGEALMITSERRNLNYIQNGFN